MHVEDIPAVGEKAGRDPFVRQGLGPNGFGQQAGSVALVSGVFSRERLEEEGGFEDFAADIR